MLRPGKWSRRPDDVHEALRSPAAVEGASLSELVLHQTRTTAPRPSNAEIMARAAHLSGLLGLQEAVDLVRARRTTGDRRQVIVVDASTPVAAPVEERAPGALTREHTAAADLHALHLSDVEVLCHIELLC